MTDKQFVWLLATIIVGEHYSISDINARLNRIKLTVKMLEEVMNAD